MNKRVLLIILLIATILSPARAVLKEQNLDNTLSILRSELTNYRTELERQSGFMKEQQTQVVDKLFGIMNKSSQNSLMLYSQRPEYVFDLAYACHEATEQYHDYKKNVLPFRNFITKDYTMRIANRYARYFKAFIINNQIFINDFSNCSAYRNI